MSFNKDGANAHRVNSYTHQTLEKMAKNGVLVYSGTLLKLVPGSSGNMVLDIAGPGDLIEGVSEQAGQFPVDNETTLQRNIIYKPFVWDHTYKIRLIPGQTITKADVGKFIQMDADQYLDTGTISTLQGQFRIEGLFEGGKVAEVRILQWIPDPVGAPPQDIYITGVVPTATPGSYTVNMSDGSSFVADLSALLDNTDSQKIILGPGATEISITTKDGTTVYNTIDLATLVKNAETQTTLDSVEIVGNQLIVKYTGEDGAQQVKSVDATVFITDVNVQNAILTNPSAGVWNLVITETDGSTHTVNVSDLIKIITANTSSAELLGDGTAGDPLRVNVKISTQAGNGLVLLADGLYAGFTETTTTIDEPSTNSFRYTNELGVQVIITLVKTNVLSGAGTTLTSTINGVASNFDILPLIQAGETDTTLTNIANGFRYTNEAGANTDVVYDVIDQATPNPRLTITVGGVLVKTIDLNQNDIQINNVGSEWDMTDDIITITETNGDSQTLSFAKYNVSVVVQPNGDQLIYQNGNLLATVYKNSVDIAIADAGGYFASGNVEGALQEIGKKINPDNGISIGTDGKIELGGTLHQTTTIDTGAFDLQLLNTNVLTTSTTEPMAIDTATGQLGRMDVIYPIYIGEWYKDFSSLVSSGNNTFTNQRNTSYTNTTGKWKKVRIKLNVQQFQEHITGTTTWQYFSGFETKLNSSIANFAGRTSNRLADTQVGTIDILTAGNELPHNSIGNVEFEVLVSAGSTVTFSLDFSFNYQNMSTATNKVFAYINSGYIEIENV